MRKRFKLDILVLFRVRLIDAMEIAVVLLTTSKTFNVGMHSDVYEPICFQRQLR